MPENENSTPSTKTRRGRRPSLAPREVVLGLDQLERRVSFIGVGAALLLAVVTAVEWARNVKTTTTVNPLKNNTCPSGFHAATVSAKSVCQESVTSTAGAWEIRLLFIVVVALCILYFTVRRKRAGVACFAIFLGFGPVYGAGLLFVLLGSWLILRAYRLQKYGEAGFASSNRVAKERGQAKREGRSAKNSSVASTKDTAAKTLSKPEASKRYTPKKPPRRR
ncbi:MAG TPA: hypothetical protein VNF05_02690 [Acidimicrobiales bacterium]|nr:hypothetical protein [Acidimicrobiales bacterium]